MLNYELCKKLKDAGFPQKENLLLSFEDVEEINDKRQIVSAVQREEGFHRTFDYAIYPEPKIDDWTQGKALLSSILSRQYLESEEGKKYTVYVPTFSELIEACGEMFKGMVKYRTEWNAFGNRQEKVRPGELPSFTGIESLDGKGKTPEEAVANLYLALHK